MSEQDLAAIEKRLENHYATVLLDGTGRGRRAAAVADVVTLVAEVKRLRAALDEVSFCPYDEEAREIARDALAAR